MPKLTYALTADDPCKDEKLTNPGTPGPEALAVLGFSRYPVFAGRGRTLTQGCSGRWPAASYFWPLWRRPASPFAVKLLLAHVYDHPIACDRQRCFPAGGVARILRSSIRRSGQGVYGTSSTGVSNRSMSRVRCAVNTPQPRSSTTKTMTTAVSATVRIVSRRVATAHS